MSDTPRTDAHYKKILDDDLGPEYAETELRWWAEQLERELAEARTKIKDRERYIANLIAANRILAREKIDAERELVEARKDTDMINRLREYMDAAMKEGGK